MTSAQTCTEQSTVDPRTLAHEVRPLEFEDIGTVSGDSQQVQIVRDYFHQFCAPVKEPGLHGDDEKTVCPACGERFTGLLASLGVGVGIEWGLVHGEGSCSKCRWPYRGHHFIYDPAEIEAAKARDPNPEKPEPILTAHNLFLAYLPELVRGWKPPKKEEY